MNLKINNRFSTELPADPDETNETRQVKNACFSFVLPKKVSNPSLVHVSQEVASLIGITEKDVESEEFINVFSGKTILPNTRPYAMSYAGHQFGNWAGQLGDGRAIVLTEIDVNNTNYTLQLKGAGMTPYSRRADGLAVLRSSIREHLCSEAMFHLGIPTTRSLSLILTGDQVLRDVMYDGNPAYEKGAVVCRVAPSFIRFGNFELFSSQNDLKTLKLLADFTIKYYFPDIKGSNKGSYVALLESVANLTREMIVHWQRVGFVHGVMNTDNMSILGLTIDYGPYGWLEDYNPNWTPNTTDRENRRYRFGNQPEIALWNLYQLANALYPLVNEAAPLEKILEDFQNSYQMDYHAMMLSKLGLNNKEENDEQLIAILKENLQLTETDMTIFFRNLSQFKKEESEEKALQIVSDAFYKPAEVIAPIKESWLYWFSLYRNRLQKESMTDENRKIAMDGTNPKYVLRNYMAQLAIEAAEKEDYALIDELHLLLKNPYQEQEKYSKWFTKRPDWAREKVGSSMLSCSS
ncbi:YdiU family protein [Flavobacterium sp. F-380]|uniref:Protein nucleotidyltransferase YdiU n=1 Tax=Flavobacterium kayseriense TaxID=2764714 RepID=A0ABR7J817_9FLAO|nr:YdiU family protein [Flavobacterium kayseriense]MBC5841633.1 YdiU family protein [Flavobacterium kayseriense]MBC5848161.1 YdiU family protein [Flavobacterium kayseriense]